MNPIKCNFMVVQAAPDVWDVLIFAPPGVLKAFQETYTSGAFFVEKSVFNQSPMAVIPAFPNKEHAEIWKEYWKSALEDPDTSCQTCPTVREFFERVEKYLKNE